MFCIYCGAELEDNARFCTKCGASQSAEASDRISRQEPAPSVGFVEAVKLYFRNFANFSGRSRRSEYWYACLFTVLLGFVVGLIAPDLVDILSLVFLIPSIAVAVRRLHDIGKGGAWYLLAFVPLVGSIILLVWYCRDSEGDNRWGPSPKY